MGKITYTTLFQTVVRNILNVWILDSVSENRNLPVIHLLPFYILYELKMPCKLLQGTRLYAYSGKALLLLL